jgi:ribosomal protein S18 acetylase RimI-like enzyme
MRYRLATVDDAGLLAQMNRRLIRDEGHRNPMSDGELLERMRSWLDGEYQAIVFEDESGPAGYALFRTEPDHVYIRQFFVEPERRRQGIGRAAIEHLANHVWRHRPRLRLDVLVDNAAAIAFWRAVGFADYCLTMEKNI